MRNGNNAIEIQAVRHKTSSNIITAKIYVTPLFYETWWFRIGLISLILGGAFFWYRRLVSEKKRLELAVETRTAQLHKDREVIKKQADELKSLDKLKNQFFANISHELRTPLTLLISPIEGISDAKNLTDQQRSLLRIMKDNGKLLQDRVSELLELSRLTSKKVVLRKQQVHLEQLVDASTQIFIPLAQKKHIQLHIHKSSLDINIKADEIRLSKIIQNLIINAVKFTDEGGTVRCDFRVENNSLYIEIHDNGIGLKQENLDKIFQRFYQVQSIDENANPGTGIGLAMVKEYINLMEGSIEVESSYGEGTAFMVKIPVHEISLDRNIIKDQEVSLLPIIFNTSNSAAKPKLLIAEDNEDLRKYIKLTLEKYFDITDVENGEVAWNHLLQDSSIDVILSDIMMPKMNGVSLLNKVRANEELRIKPFVFLTAKHNEEDLANAYRMGVDDYLKKPFSEKELIYRLNAVYANYKSRIDFQQLSLESFDEDSSAQDQPTHQSDNEFITRLDSAILDNIRSHEFSLDLLAEKLNTSKRTLTRMVKKEVGLTPNKYIVEVKLNKARQLYESGKSTTIEDVIEQVGFSTPWYFKKIYMERFGVAPHGT